MTGNNLCDFCIKLLEWWAAHTPLTYAEINNIMFIVLQPAIIFFYFLMAIIGAKTSSKRVKRTVITLSVIVMIILVLSTIALFAIPFFAGGFYTKS